MERLKGLVKLIEEIRLTRTSECLKQLDSRLQDILLVLEECEHRTSGELIDLKNCSWTIHERYYLDEAEDLKWTFHHTKHRILRNCLHLLERYEIKKVA